MLRFSIRRAKADDCAEIARLATQLGYPVTPKAMGARLKRLIGSEADAVFVAQTADGAALLGWIHAVLSQYLESDFRVEITGLIVDETVQRKGLGRALVAQVEAWARRRGAVQASVRCRTTRPEAHRFYEGLGYGQYKTQIVFRKPLSEVTR